MPDPSTESQIDALPPRQKDVLRYIIELTEEHGYPPTLAELAKALGLRNRMTVHQHVAALKKKGLVHWEPGLNRSLKVVGPACGSIGRKDSLDEPQEENNVKPIGLPLAGTIAAGQPLDALQSDEYLQIDTHYAGEGCFALKIKGESMIEDGIYDGDFVIVKPNPSPRNGEIVVALLDDGSATLKRFFKEGSGYRLQPANKEMEPIFVRSANDLQIQGTVVGLFRKM
ncbi:MAG TPA: transcriptional repressor LexA [Planktothrix sp.]|jgi:repressor LexA